MSRPIFVYESHSYKAPAERVFDAWLTPNQAARFLFASQRGNVMHCEIDPRVGGSFIVTDRRPNPDTEESFLEAQHRGVFVEIERPRRLVFDFSADPYSQVTTRVSIDIVATGTGCDLMLTHNLGDSEEARHNADQTRRGWNTMLRQLEKVLATRIWGFKIPGSA